MTDDTRDDGAPPDDTRDDAEPTDDTRDAEPTDDDDVRPGLTTERRTEREPAALAERLRERAHPLATTDPTAPLADFDPVGERLAEATVVGLGEATHGTREFFRLKHRAVRYLVEEAGLRAVAMEANFAETLAIDEYVVRGEGDPKAAIDGIYFWTWDTQEVLELVEWLRAFNEGRPVDDRVRFYGLDAQYTAGAAERLTDYLQRVDADWLDAHRDTLSMLAEEGIEVDWPDDDGEATTADCEDGAGPDEAVVAARELVDALVERFDERESEYVDATDRDEYDLHRRLVRTLDQAVAYRDLRGRDPERAIADRDEAMAENVRWVLDREDADRVALWAHDEHVRRDRRDHESEAVPGTGTHLADAFGDDYYALGFDFARGEFRAVGDGELGTFSLGDPPADAATRLFDAAPRPVDEGGDGPTGGLLFVDLEAACEDDGLADWFDAERPKRSLGAVYYGEDAVDDHHDDYRLPGSFDGLLFVAETSPARPIERGEDGEGGEREDDGEQAGDD